MATTDILVDTSVFIDHLRKQNKANTLLYRASARYKLYTSTIVEFELASGAGDAQKRQDVQAILQPCTILPFTSDIAQQSALLYQTLRQQNQLIDMRDIFIGATAIVFALPLLTINTNHFSRLPLLDLLPHP